ncbi:NAD(P)H-quinone oxidoreductase subunit 3 [Streptomyces sp. SID8364]|nr:NAD(P)H-quinone oxidoreductase subunit 3 [Streptomyces sp. SID8364]
MSHTVCGRTRSGGGPRPRSGRAQSPRSRAPCPRSAPPRGKSWTVRHARPGPPHPGHPGPCCRSAWRSGARILPGGKVNREWRGCSVGGFGVLAALAGLTLAGLGGIAALARLAAVGPVVTESLPHLGGLPPAEHALSRFHVRWYTVTMVFLAFDMEMIFMYPWTLVVPMMGTSSVVEMFLFLALLLSGVLYAWREGALRWT